MAMRVATMSPSDNSSITRNTGQLSRKLVLLFLLTSAYALGLVLLLHQRLDFPLILFTFFADCTVALAAGFGARFILSKRNRFIRSAAAITMVLTGLGILGYFSKWEIGVDVPQLMRGYVSWMDLSHLGLGILAALSAVWAWGRSRPAHQVVEVPVRTPVIPASSNATRSVRPRIRLPQNWSLNLREMPGLRSRSSSGNGSRSSVRVQPKLISGQSVKVKRRKAKHRQAHVQLALVEEHRCPYCLEPVLRTDPGGVKECEICHSLHHADCWSITGTCQVPHLN